MRELSAISTEIIITVRHWRIRSDFGRRWVERWRSQVFWLHGSAKLCRFMDFERTNTQLSLLWW